MFLLKKVCVCVCVRFLLFMSLVLSHEWRRGRGRGGGRAASHEHTGEWLDLGWRKKRGVSSDTTDCPPFLLPATHWRRGLRWGRGGERGALKRMEMTGRRLGCDTNHCPSSSPPLQSRVMFRAKGEGHSWPLLFLLRHRAYLSYLPLFRLFAFRMYL